MSGFAGDPAPAERDTLSKPTQRDKTRDYRLLGHDALGLAQELEVHGVAQLRVATEPIEAVFLEGVDPATRQLGAVEDRFGAALTGFVIGPGRDAAAAWVAVRVDVDGDAEQVVGDFGAAVAIF